MKILLIVPSYNEEANIERNIKNILAYKETLEKTHPDLELCYMIINDCSTDGTFDLIEKNGYEAIHLECNLGIGGAVQTGYMYASKHEVDIAVQFDGDGQHDINSLFELIQPIIEGRANLTVGSRFIKKGSSGFQTSMMRRAGIKLIASLIKMVTGKRIMDVTSGYRAADKTVIKYFSKVYPQSYPEPESLVHLMKKGFAVLEIPVNMFERSGGVSSITALKSVKYMLEVGASVLIAGSIKS